MSKRRLHTIKAEHDCYDPIWKQRTRRVWIGFQMKLGLKVGSRIKFWREMSTDEKEVRYGTVMEAGRFVGMDLVEYRIDLSKKWF